MPVWWSGRRGPQGNQGAQGDMGPQGPAGLSSIGTPSSPSRPVNTNFTPNESSPSLVGYAFNLHTELTAVGTSFAQVQLLADPGPSPPVTVRSTARHQLVLGVGLSINQQSDVISSVYAMIPAGWICRLVTSAGNGGTVTSVAQTEVPLTP